MSTLTSTLAIRVDDAGLVSKLRADAEALKNFGASASKIKAAPGGAELLKQFERLQGAASKLDGFAAASKGLDGLGARLRAARDEVGKTARSLVAAERKSAFFDRSKASGSANYPGFVGSGAVAEAAAGLKAARRASAAAIRAAAGIEDAFTRQKIAVRGAGKELERAGTPLANVAKAQGQTRAQMEALTASIWHQVKAHEDNGVAAAASGAEASRRARAQLRATVAAGRQAHADREHAVVTEASRRASAGRDMAAGMGSAGRRQSTALDGGRRLADGLSAPARQSRAREQARLQAEAEDDVARREERRGGQRMLAGVAGVALGHKVHEGTKEVLSTYREFDDLRRYQGAVSDLSPDESKSRVSQALHLGGTTRFNDLQVLQAQLNLAQRGVKKEFVEPFVGEVVNYAQAMSTDLGTAAKTLEGIVFSTNQDVEDPKSALQVMRRQVDLAVKASKIGGLSNEDLAQAFKFGGASGSAAGLSNETMLANYALLHRSGYSGSEAGVAQRAIAGKLVSPTMKGLDALDAMGIRWENFSTMKRGAGPELADNMMKRHFGKGLSGKQRTAMGGILEDEDTMGDRGKFVEAAVDAVADSFVQTTGKNKGKLSAKDRAGLAKKFGNFHKNLIESIDSEGLWDAIINANPTLSQANAWGTDKHGGKIMALARKAKEVKEYKEQLRHTPENFAKGIGDARNAGYAGAATRLEGSRKNFDSRVGQSLDNGGDGGLLTNLTDAAARATQALAELPDSVLAAGASIAWLGGKASSALGTAALLGGATGIGAGVAAGKGGAMVAAGLAGAAVAAPVVGAALATAALVAADKSKGIVHGGRNVGPAQLNPSDELPGLAGSTEAPTWVRRGGSLPPGTAGMPAPAPVRLPGLDGRPAQTAAPKVDTSSIEAVGPKAEGAKAAIEGLNVTAKPNIDTSSLAATEAIVDRIAAKIAALGSAAAGAAASANGTLAGIRARANAGSSFSDGVTQGP